MIFALTSWFVFLSGPNLSLSVFLSFSLFQLPFSDVFISFSLTSVDPLSYISIPFFFQLFFPKSFLLFFLFLPPSSFFHLLPFFSTRLFFFFFKCYSLSLVIIQKVVSLSQFLKITKHKFHFIFIKFILLVHLINICQCLSFFLISFFLSSVNILIYTECRKNFTPSEKAFIHELKRNKHHFR